ncbi:MAG: hypothetical protein AAF547_17480 [Actinomycetota bacterium]
MEDLRFTEVLGIMPLLVLIVFLGIYPKPVLERIEPAVDNLIAHVESKVDDFEEEEPDRVDRAGTPALIGAAEKASEKSEETAEGGDEEEAGE